VVNQLATVPLSGGYNNTLASVTPNTEHIIPNKTEHARDMKQWSNYWQVGPQQYTGAWVVVTCYTFPKQAEPGTLWHACAVRHGLA
jgi:hypothetical protein